MKLKAWQKLIVSFYFERNPLSTLFLVGSERNRVSGAKSEILKEACHINKSLSTIGRVIRGLVDSQKTGHGHIPYRDSKLTYLLQVCEHICL